MSALTKDDLLVENEKLKDALRVACDSVPINVCVCARYGCCKGVKNKAGCDRIAALRALAGES